MYTPVIFFILLMGDGAWTPLTNNHLRLGRALALMPDDLVPNYSVPDDLATDLAESDPAGR